MPKNDKKKGSAPAERISDSRFANFESDPRFRLPSKKNTKTKLDKRFAGVLNDKEFTDVAKVDRYGRKIKTDTKKKAMQRLYEAESGDEDEDDDEEEEADIEVEDDDVVARELRKADKAAVKLDAARGGGGFESSDEDSDSEEDSEDEIEEIEEGDLQKLQDEQADVETGEVSKRFAVVHLDWDHVNSTDLYALFASFLKDGQGSLEKVSVYPSEFGKERMQQEETEGPPKELFKDVKKDESSDDEDDSDDDDEKIRQELIQEGDDQDFDSDALRKYQMDRLRYYYAVVEFSSEEAAQIVYEATDGTEYQSSSNFIDLRFIPDDTTFDEEARDECTGVSDKYKPLEFVTSALQSSKVKLTWDLHPEEATRKEAVKRAFTGSRNDINENDLRAYLASDSEDSDAAPEADDDENEKEQEDKEDGPKLSKKELARKKMREALGLTEESSAKASKDAPVGDMEITFTSALSESKSKDDDNEEETTIEKYKRKERERKEKKREKSRVKRGEEPADKEEEATFGAGEDDLGFNDPFFTTDEPSAAPTKSSIRKEERRKKRDAREAEEAEAAKEREHLSKVMAEDSNEKADHLDHFDMAEIMRAEKIRGKTGKAAKSKKNRDKLEKAQGMLQDDFEMDVDDDRFKAVFDSHEFAIDPSNPKYKATGGMKKLLEEGRKKRRGDDGDGEERVVKKKAKGRR